MASGNVKATTTTTKYPDVPPPSDSSGGMLLFFRQSWWAGSTRGPRAPNPPLLTLRSERGMSGFILDAFASSRASWSMFLARLVSPKMVVR